MEKYLNINDIKLDLNNKRAGKEVTLRTFLSNMSYTASYL